VVAVNERSTVRGAHCRTSWLNIPLHVSVDDLALQLLISARGMSSANLDPHQGRTPAAACS